MDLKKIGQIADILADKKPALDGYLVVIEISTREIVYLARIGNPKEAHKSLDLALSKAKKSIYLHSVAGVEELDGCKISFSSCEEGEKYFTNIMQQFK